MRAEITMTQIYAVISIPIDFTLLSAFRNAILALHWGRIVHFSLMHGRDSNGNYLNFQYRIGLK